MSEQTSTETPQEAPAIDTATMSSLEDYRAVRDQLARETALREDVPAREPAEAPVEAAEAPSEAPDDGSAEAQAGQRRDERGRFTRAEAGADAEAPAEAATDDAARAKKRNPQERIAHVVWEREEAKRQASEARRQADELRYQLEQARRSQVQATPQPPAQGQPQNRQPADPDAPRPDQFERYEDFVMANAQFAADKRVRQELARLQSEAQAQQLEQMRSSRAQQFSDRVKAAEANDPEFLTKVSPEVLNLRPAMNLQPGETPDGGTAVADYLVELDDPRPMMLHLSEHPEEFRRITALHPMFAMRELGRLDARLYAAPTGPASVSPAVSRAKPPIRPVGAGSQAPTAHRDPSRMNSLAEYRAWRAANPTS